MKKFKYNHSPLVYVLLSVILLITLIGCYFSVYNAIISAETHKLIAFISLSVINAFLFLTVLLILTSSKYVIKNDKIKVFFGYFKVVYDINEIYSLTELIDVKKLLINFKDGRYVFAVINKIKIEEFISAVKQENPEVVFDINYTVPQKKE